MSAYVISDVQIRDTELAARYREIAAASIHTYGGRYVARAGTVERLEGQWEPSAVVIVEFPDMATARAWYASPEYAQALDYRDLALSRNLILVEGV